MPLDPNIILSGLQQQRGVDMNALVQQQISGMENINALERQRRADDLVMQDRAAAQAKEQEAAAIKALLPAYTYGIQTGDIAGAGNLAPPEMRGQLQPFIDALTGKSPQEVQAALIGSLASSGEVGQKALDAIQRAGTLSVQQGQLDVSREDIKLRRQKQALDAQGQGAWELKEGIDENGAPIFVWTNPRTRQIVKADITGGVPAVTPGAVPGPTPIPAPDVVTPRQPAPGAPEAVPPAATGQPAAEFRPKPKDGKTSESERVAAYNAGRTLLSAADIFNTIKSDPDAVAPGALETAVGLFVDPNFVRSAERQIVSSAQYEAVDALLTLATGAAYNQEQRNSQIQRYIPLYSDKPETREYKKRALLDTIQVAKAKSGAAWTPEMDAALEKLGLVDETKTQATPESEDPELNDLLEKYLPK